MRGFSKASAPPPFSRRWEPSKSCQARSLHALEPSCQQAVHVLEYREKLRLLGVTLDSSTHTNLGHTAVIMLKKKVWVKVWYFQITFSVEIVGPCYFLTSFAALARRGEPRTVVVKTKIGKDPLINNFLLHNNTVLLSPKEILNFRICFLLFSFDSWLTGSDTAVLLNLVPW